MDPASVDTVMSDVDAEKMPAPMGPPKRIMSSKSLGKLPVSSVAKSMSELEQIMLTASPEPYRVPCDIMGTYRIRSLGEELPKRTKGILPFADLPTGLCYDVRMRYHSEIEPSLDVHPEDPRRIYSIYDILCQAGLTNDNPAPIPLSNKFLVRINSRPATFEEITRIHTQEHFDFIQRTKSMTKEELKKEEEFGDSVYYNKMSSLCAALAAGAAIETCYAVASRQAKNALAVIRPPGHHAESHCSGGFCLFNNISIAARAMQAEFGLDCRKVLILDWDVHHGNGTQHCFYDDPNILYISLHVYMNGHFYPPRPDGGSSFCGIGAGLGRNVNIPWPCQGMGDADYMYAFQNIVMPIAYEFDPQLVIVSAGFDAAEGDILGGCHVSPACYSHMTHMLMSLAQGKIAVCLEGGYNLLAISKSALAVTRTLMGEPPDRMVLKPVSTQAISAIQKVRKHQSKYWKCLQPQSVEAAAERLGAERMHDIIRNYQYLNLFKDYDMISLFIFRDKLTKSFENQVLATRNFKDKAPLLVIFHDPPEVIGNAQLASNKLELHETWLADNLKGYIGWSVANKFSVIDVNIPKFLTSFEIDSQDVQMEEEPFNKQEITLELARYLWENYIEPYDAANIFFLGVGKAFEGLIHLLNTYEDCGQRVSGVISFVANNDVFSVSNRKVYWLAKWYMKHSLVFVSHNHETWTANPKKHLKRSGHLVQSPVSGLSEMLVKHKEEVFSFILSKIQQSKGSSDEG